MSETLYEALDICLQAIEDGADIEACLARFPEQAEELRPILETATQARAIAVEDVPANVQRRGKARVMREVSEMREAAFTGHQRWLTRRVYRLAFTTLAVLVFLVSGGTGLVSASSNTVPGDNLYQVKRTWEDVQLWFVQDPQARQQLAQKFDHERVQEVKTLFGEKREEDAEFLGVLSAQNGDLWQVAGIEVRVDANTKFDNPVSIGAMIKVEGLTMPDGTLLASDVQLVTLPGLAPTVMPTQPQLSVPTLTVPSGLDDKEQLFLTPAATESGNGSEDGSSNISPTTTEDGGSSISPTTTEDSSSSSTSTKDDSSGSSDGVDN